MNALICISPSGPNGVKLADVSVDDFDRVYGVNLRGSFNVTKHALRAMTPQNYGRILLIASIAGKDGNAVSAACVHHVFLHELCIVFDDVSPQGMAAYSTSKAGVIGLAKGVGKEYAETGITVNALAPAVIRTGSFTFIQRTNKLFLLILLLFA